MQATISCLPGAVRICSIPRRRLESLSHPVLRALLHPAPAFLSITCNALELSLFAEPESLRALEAIARAELSNDASNASNATTEPIEISEDRWSVLQIDSHSDQLDNAGARVNELSAPLAAAGISILYQSSYMSDFIFVKERRLAEAMSLFAAAGFALYASDPNLLTALLAPPCSPVLTRERSSSAPASTTSALASRSPSKASSRSAHSKPKSKSTPHPKSASNPPQNSKSPVRDVLVLAPDLACVGLADDAAAHWALKIVKLVAFPDLIPLPASMPSRRGRTPIEEECEDTDDAGYFSHSPSPTVDEPDPDPGPAEETKTTDADVNVLPSRSRAQAVPSRLDALPGPLAWLAPADECAEDQEARGISGEPQTVTSPPPTPGDARPSRVRAPPPEYAVPFFTFTRTPEGSSLTTGARVLAALFPRAERHMVICGGELDAADREVEAQEMEATAHSPSASSFASASGRSSPSRARFYSDDDDDDDADSVDWDEYRDMDAHGEDGDAHPLLSALQIDLRGAGLDTHGLVHRFSRALAQSGVNHMYASTLRSANLLVPSGQGGRARRLLRGC
ncbi:hypothetical protein C8R44DRAFT_829938 [Mycena epipterygia]|nr:hypothetical protein C8R44DRAFT_829938 [Mycena epipterygia]